MSWPSFFKRKCYEKESDKKADTHTGKDLWSISFFTSFVYIAKVNQ